MDTVFIENLAVNAVVGIFDWERAVPQQIIINIEMASDVSKAAQSENINDALDYSLVARRTSEFIVSSQFLLLETLAEKTTSLIMAEFNVPWLRFSCTKTQAMRNVSGVGVRIERGERPNG
ncbi:dihydroneopterin aldolase [Agarilytica rhodophyticola]|uniref:dihydroneopterin aldolase n=1 Tax=Agarilytica rhodophyticola TaxID=1737490 RepID=UPI000B345AC2|nr:dihydroneopterin aldolase [Agarilytica rhodophyticola]